MRPANSFWSAQLATWRTRLPETHTLQVSAVTWRCLDGERVTSTLHIGHSLSGDASLSEGKRHAAEPRHPAAASRANVIRQTACSWLVGGSRNEVIHQCPQCVCVCVWGFVWRNPDTRPPCWESVNRHRVLHFPVVTSVPLIALACSC